MDCDHGGTIGRYADGFLSTRVETETALRERAAATIMILFMELNMSTQ
jgi:hypothetical protein